MTDTEELAEKYQKLFQDYSRIKAQHAVLKKAVLQEQTNNATLQAALKEKEQEVRKSLQQLDLLSFHNQRLTKRIENLQEIGSPKSSGSWVLGGGSAKKALEKTQEAYEVAMLDLQNKIEENEKLHQQLYEINALYPRHVTELQSKIQELEKQNQELQLDVERAGVANEDTINLIRKEKDDIEKELGMIRDALAGQLQDERRSNESLKTKILKLEDDIQRLSEVERQFEGLRTEHTNLKAELETFKFISAEYTQLQASHHQLEQQKVQLDKAHIQLLEEFNALKKAEESLRLALDKEAAKARSLQEHVDGLARSLDTLKATSTAKEQEQSKRISDLTTELEQMKQQQTKLQQEYEQLKEAGETAKRDESRSKATLAEELHKTEEKLKETESLVQELETLKQKLEEDLEKTKAELTEANAAAAAAAATVGAAAESTKEDKPVDNEDSVNNEIADETAEKSQREDGHLTDGEGSKEQKSLSKNQRKKKKKAAAAAAAAATAATASSVSEDKTTDAIPATSDEVNTEALSKDSHSLAEEVQEVKERLGKAVAEKEELHAEQEKLLKQIEVLQAEISTAQGLNANKEKELKKAQDSLEALQSEKETLSNSLARHVEITLQLQQELDDLKKQHEQKALNKAVPKANGYPLEVKASLNEDDEEESLERKVRHPSKTSSLSPAHKDAEDRDNEDKTSQQVEENDTKSSEAAIEPLLIDLEPPKENGAHKFADITAGVVEGKIVAEDSNPSLIEHQPAIPSSTAQAQREYLIKKHYEAKLKNLTEQLQFADSRYVRLHREFGLLEELLKETARQQAEQAKANKALEAQNKELRAELEEAKEENRRQVETMTQFMQSLEQH
ncbi:hypothetical protein BGW41_001889 [Actinomortierella wolfii]|nr:hypothetical protein BGW41_001889 [Actinomortierella wolfii]